MICITPNTIKNPDKMGLRFGGGTHMQVPCRKCTACQQKRAQQWTFRLQQEHKIARTATFLTLTYDEETLPHSGNGLPTLHPTHHTLFMKKLRKAVPKGLKYYMVGEYGGKTERPHFHSILFNLPPEYIQTPELIQQIWKHGNIQADTVTKNSIAYVCGYVNKQKYFVSDDPNDDRLPEYSRMSKNLGTNFLTPQRIQYLKNHLEPTIQIEGGTVIALPAYYKKKALTEEEQKIISNKAMDYAIKNPTFTSEQHHFDYVRTQSNRRKYKAKTERKNIQT